MQRLLSDTLKLVTDREGKEEFGHVVHSLFRWGLQRTKQPGLDVYDFVSEMGRKRKQGTDKEVVGNCTATGLLEDSDDKPFGVAVIGNGGTMASAKSTRHMDDSDDESVGGAAVGNRGDNLTGLQQNADGLASFPCITKAGTSRRATSVFSPSKKCKM